MAYCLPLPPHLLHCLRSFSTILYPGMKSKGTVFLVGAGPGDSGLMTLRGADLLRRADVVVYDALVNKDLLRFAPKSAEIIYGGKRSKDHAIPQSELNQLLIAKAREGK